jgi:pyruvate ferredoxin oxidoreductase gamma subunit
MPEQDFINDMLGSFQHKFAKKPEVIEGNMKALQLALERVTQVQ